MTMTRKPLIVAGKTTVPDRIPGLNRVARRLADGRESVYYYHRATGTRLPGEFGSPEFLAALAAAQSSSHSRTAGTLAGVIRDFEQTAKWRKLAESTKAEYRRVFKFWDAEYGSLPIKALESRAFRQDVLQWHDRFSSDKPREADNRVVILARVLSWAAADRTLKVNVLSSFDRAYSSDRAGLIWLPEHIEAFMRHADPEMGLAMMLALHTGQRQADLRRLAWTNYDGNAISLRQGKTKRQLRIPCTRALKEVLDNLPRRGALILTTKTGRAFQKRYLARKWEAVVSEAAKEQPDMADLHFHDVRGTTITLLFEGGCTVAEAATIAGHSMRRAQEILDWYLARTGYLAEAAILKFENRMKPELAKRPAKRHPVDQAK
ncbi:MAG: tyrosine-type recombinase/integrase [Devosia sp.]